MKNQARRAVPLLFLFALGGALASCTTPTSSSSSSGSSSSSQAEIDVMPEKLIVGMECDYQPFNWSSNTQSDFTLPISNHAGSYADGYDVQIAKLLGQSLGLEVEIVQTSWTALIPDLQMGSLNMILAGMTDTAERRESINFTNEYYRSELVLIVQESVSSQYSSALSSEDLRSLISGEVLISQTGTVTDDILDTFQNEYGSTHGASLETFGDCAYDVSMGTAFAMTAELPVAQSLCESFDNLGIIHIDQEILGETQSELGVSIGVRKGMDRFTSALNEALASISSETRVSLMTDAVNRSGN